MFVRQSVSLVCLVLVGWVLYSFGISHINSKRLIDNPQSELIFENDSNLLSADARVKLAEQLIERGSIKKAEALALAALSDDPTSGRVASLLLALYEKSNQVTLAAQVGRLAGRLWPVHTYTHARLANYWAARGEFDKLLVEWNILLIRSPAQSLEIFPKLKAVTLDVGRISLLDPFISNPPRWWDSFYAHLAGNGASLQELKYLFYQRIASKVPPSTSERNTYVNRLIKNGSWQEAYDIWYLGLSQIDMRLGGLVFDGGFESSLSNQGFAWAFSRSKNPRIQRGITYGIKGGKALQVILRKDDRVNFRHVSQRLLLRPGLYSLSLRYRLDTFKNPKGLSWRIHCIVGGRAKLGESRALKGRAGWTSTKVDFIVPESCSVQFLRLEATSPYAHDHTFSGSIWFDDIVISKRKRDESN